jgi:hypothetical protein
MGSLARNSKRRMPAPSVRPSSKSRPQPARRPPPSNRAVQALLTGVRFRLETVTACTVIVVAALRAQNADRRHGDHEPRVFAQDCETSIPAVTRKSDNHRGQAHCQRKATSKLDVHTEQQHESGNQQLTASDTEERSDDPDDEPGADLGQSLEGSSNGSRNSAPPRPINPPSTPMSAPPRNATHDERTKAGNVSGALLKNCSSVIAR